MRGDLTEEKSKFTVLGPPGTGKTYYLTQLVERATNRYGSNGVVVASLTKAAATEIARRISSTGLDVPPTSDRHHHVGTLHSICLRAMGSPKVFAGSVMQDFNLEHKRDITAKAQGDDLGFHYRTDDDRLYAQVTMLRQNMVPEAVWPATCQQLHREIETHKSCTGTVDFTDMIEAGLHMDPPGSHDVIIYDEAQDGSKMEIELIRRWGEKATHTVIAGDDDQALYTWRGASIESFLGFSEQKKILGKSYRLPSAVHAYAERWGRQISNRWEKPYAPMREGGFVKQVPWSLTYPEESLPTILGHTSEGQSVMILATTHDHLKSWISVLRKHSIPFHNQYAPTNGALNPLRRSRKTPQPTDRAVAFAKAQWSWHDVWLWADMLRVRGGVITSEVKKRLETRKGDYSLVDSSDEEIARIVRMALEGGPDWWYSEILASHRSKYNYPIGVVAKNGCDFKPQITLGTIHSVKGGEHDIVVCHPDLSTAGYLDYTSGQEGADKAYRTFYVAITRAKEGVYLCDPAARSRGRMIEWL